jgi:hypothetical protein
MTYDSALPPGTSDSGEPFTCDPVAATAAIEIPACPPNPLAHASDDGLLALVVVFLGGLTGLAVILAPLLQRRD